MRLREAVVKKWLILGRNVEMANGLLSVEMHAVSNWRKPRWTERDRPA